MVENTKNVHISESFLQILLEFGILLNWKTNENFIEIALFIVYPRGQQVVVSLLFLSPAILVI